MISKEKSQTKDSVGKLALPTSAPTSKQSSTVDDLWAELNNSSAPKTTESKNTLVEPILASQKKTITETYSFAGEDVVVTKTVDIRESTTKEVQPEKKGKGNLSSLVASLNSSQPKKLSTIQKSSLDWNSYKTKKGLEEELKQATKDGYLEKQAFRQRTDLRQFENEKSIRNKDRARKKS